MQLDHWFRHGRRMRGNDPAHALRKKMLLGLLILGFCAPLRSQDFFEAQGRDIVRVSVKHILNEFGERSKGRYTENGAIEETFFEINKVLLRLNVPWKFKLVEVVDAAGAPGFFSLGTTSLLNTAERSTGRGS